MRQGLVFGCLLLAGAINANAGSANGSFAVKVAIGVPGSSVCTTASSAGGAVQVQCTTPVFVSISQISPVSNQPSSPVPSPQPFIGQFVGVFGSAMASHLSESNGYGELPDDSAGDAERGWNFDRQLYALELDTAPLQGKTIAQLRQRNQEGTLTAVQVSRATGGADTVEMLVSF